jgi:hypothetical protein
MLQKMLLLIDVVICILSFMSSFKAAIISDLFFLISQNRLKLQYFDLFFEEKSDKTRTTIRQLLEKRSETTAIPTPSEPTTSQVTEPTQNGTKRKRKSNSISPRSKKTPAVKRKSRKDSTSDKVTSQSAKKKRTSSKSAENEANRQALQTQIQSIIEGLREDSTQSFVDFDHVEGIYFSPF